MKIAIVVSEFNFDVTRMMLEMAREHARFLGVEVARVHIVPGVFELPMAAKHALSQPDIDGVAALGAVIEGETRHDEVVIQHAARKIMDLGLETGKPVGLGITGPGMSRLQAEARIERARAAVEAIVKMHRLLTGSDTAPVPEVD